MILEELSEFKFNLLERKDLVFLIMIIENNESINNQDILIKYTDRNNHENYFLYNESNRERFLDILKNEYNDRRSSEVVSVKIFKIKSL